MTDEKNENINKPITFSLKVVIYLGIVSGILLGSYEIVNNIPKYEYIKTDGLPLIFNKINGNVYVYSENIKNHQIENFVETFNLISVISEEKFIDRKNRITKEKVKNAEELLENGTISREEYESLVKEILLDF